MAQVFGNKHLTLRTMYPVMLTRVSRSSTFFRHKPTDDRFKVGLAGICGLVLVGRQLGRNDYEETYLDCKSKDKNGLRKFNGVWLPRVMFGSKVWQEIQNFSVHPDDVFVISYPKSGTTWVQEIVYLLLNIDNIDQASKDNLGTVFPYLEFPYPGLKTINEKPGPRTIKTHLPYEVLPEDMERVKPKIIYIARNVKDVSVSYFHFHRSMAQVSYSGSFNDFLENFLIGRVPYDSWWKHVRSFWDRRDEKNIHFMKYEDLKQVSVFKEYNRIFCLNLLQVIVYSLELSIILKTTTTFPIKIPYS